MRDLSTQQGLSDCNPVFIFSLFFFFLFSSVLDCTIVFKIQLYLVIPYMDLWLSDYWISILLHSRLLVLFQICFFFFFGKCSPICLMLYIPENINFVKECTCMQAQQYQLHNLYLLLYFAFKFRNIKHLLIALPCYRKWCGLDLQLATTDSSVVKQSMVQRCKYLLKLVHVCFHRMEHSGHLIIKTVQT